MAQLDGMQRYGDSNKSHGTQNAEQVLHGPESSSWSSSSAAMLRGHDAEDDHGLHHHKKSVLMKVKETAKKLRHTLSHKKRNGDDDNHTPSWGVRLEDYEDDAGGPEYLGAPMYGSEMASDSIKDSARQHPKSITSDKHSFTGPEKLGSEHVKEKVSSPNKTRTTSNNHVDTKKPYSPNKRLTGAMAAKLAPARASWIDAKNTITSKFQGYGLGSGAQATNTETDKHSASQTEKSLSAEKSFSPNKTVTEKVTEKLAPAYATVSDATHAVTSKLPGFTGDSTARPEATESNKHGGAAETTNLASLEKSQSRNKTITETMADATSAITSKIPGLSGGLGAQPQAKETDKNSVAKATSLDSHEKSPSSNKTITETLTDATYAITSRIPGFSAVSTSPTEATTTDKHSVAKTTSLDSPDKSSSPSKTMTETLADATHAITSRIPGFSAGTAAQPEAKETDKPSVAKSTSLDSPDKSHSPSKTITETLSGATHAITSKIPGFTGGSEAQPDTTNQDSLEKTQSPSKTISETLTDATHAVTSKIPGFSTDSVAQPEATETEKRSADSLEKSHSPNKTLTETVTEKLAPAYATMSDATHAVTSKLQSLTVSTQSNSEATNQSSSDKSVSVKEYIMHKFEPGEDDKALSQVISQAMSPKTPGDPGGVVTRVKGAVTSLLWDEESKNNKKSDVNSSLWNNVSKDRVIHSTSHSIASIPISTNAHEIVEEENHGRVLQAN